MVADLWQRKGKICGCFKNNTSSVVLQQCQNPCFGRFVWCWLVFFFKVSDGYRRKFYVMGSSEFIVGNVDTEQMKYVITNGTIFQDLLIENGTRSGTQYENI